MGCGGVDGGDVDGQPPLVSEGQLSGAWSGGKHLLRVDTPQTRGWGWAYTAILVLFFHFAVGEIFLK